MLARLEHEREEHLAPAVLDLVADFGGDLLDVGLVEPVLGDDNVQLVEIARLAEPLQAVELM